MSNTFNVNQKEQLVQIILRDLNTPDVFPVGALVNAKHIHKELEPYLLADLSQAIEAVKRDEEPSQMSFFALHLLSEFRTPELYPLLLRILRLNEPQLDCLVGDALTESIGRMIAASFSGIPEDLWEIFDDQALFEYARSAALTGLLVLVLHNKIAYDSMVPQVRLRFIKSMEAEHTEDVTRLMSFIMHARMSALYDLVRQAFERDLIELMMYGDQDDFAEECALPIDLSYTYHNFIGGAYEELRSWDSMQTMGSIGLGGNDACWCGSGKKYKKCCVK